MFESTLPPAGGKTQTPGVTGASFDQTCQKLPNMASRNASGHPVPKLTPKQRWISKAEKREAESVGGRGEKACLWRGQQQVSWTGWTGFYGAADSCGTDDYTKYHE